MRTVAPLSSVLSMLAAMGLASVAFAQSAEPRGGREMRERGPRLLLISRESEGASEGAGTSVDAAAHGPHRRERMSPEERQRLRRDIHDAGRDIYRHGQLHTIRP